jgi:hypothetical protein
MTLYGPDGARLNGTGASHLIYTLATTGIYTVEISNGFGAVAPVTVRVNTAAPPEPLMLGALTQRSATLAIGEVRRYAFDITRGQLLALRMSTTTGLPGQAQIDGGNIYNGYVTVSAPNQTTGLQRPDLRAAERRRGAVALFPPAPNPAKPPGRWRSTSRRRRQRRRRSANCCRCNCRRRRWSTGATTSRPRAGTCSAGRTSAGSTPRAAAASAASSGDRSRASATTAATSAAAARARQSRRSAASPQARTR